MQKSVIFWPPTGASTSTMTSFYPVIPIMKIGFETEMRNVCREDYCQGRRNCEHVVLNMGLAGGYCNNLSFFIDITY